MRVALVVACFAGVLAWDASAQKADKPAAGKSDAAAMRLFRARCSACHAIDRVSHRRASRDEWREIVDRMRRMPQSGISPKDARVILDVLVAMNGGQKAEENVALGGHRVFGRKRWLAILETARVRKGKVKIGGVAYTASLSGRTLTLKRGKKSHELSFRGNGKPGKSSVIDSWRVGDVRYEIRLVLYEIRGGVVRVGRAIRRRS